MAINPYVRGIREIGRTQAALVGGKGAQLGELSRIEGIVVPRGFCVTTNAFDRVLSSVTTRVEVEEVDFPSDVVTAITGALHDLGAAGSYAVRSSATAEDLPSASFAGQHDSYLNVVGVADILHAIRRCWASLLSDRAVAYRQRSGFGDRIVKMAVIVQRMIAARASGVLFTADPLSGNRRVSSVEAVSGLGDALVAGRANADTYKVRDNHVTEKSIRSRASLLTDAEVVRLAQQGRAIESHFGSPQDIEWCLDGDEFSFVQSRPITTLFPVPPAIDDRNRVYISVGHQQMMTDAMKPLGVSLWQLTAARPMYEAAGRLFVDVTRELSAPASRAALFELAGRSDLLIRDALQTVLDDDFIPTLPGQAANPAPPTAPGAPLEPDPALVTDLVARSEASLAALERDIAPLSGLALIDFILRDIDGLKRILFDPESYRVLVAAMDAASSLNEKLRDWLGEKNVADVLTQSVPDNVTSAMGLALLDVADVIRPYPEVIAFLGAAEADGFIDELPNFAGGDIAQRALLGWLDKYGMRGVGEIDITRPRWRERPSMLVPIILGHIANFEEGEAQRRFERGRRAAERKAKEVLTRLRALPDGEQKAEQARRWIDVVRTFSGYREYPKYALVSRYFVYKIALLREANALVKSRVIRHQEDVYFLTMSELRDVVHTHELDHHLIDERRQAFESYRSLTPPRVLTSEGERIDGEYRRTDVPTGALVGMPVSAGTVEGRARVILNIADSDLQPGDILVTTFTDPSWTPVFVTIAALVTEVGGLMTHGAVIAREYGLPAVVGVADATTRIQDGRRIRVHGTAGYIEILPE